MSRLLIESNFIAKLYREYSLIMREYQRLGATATSPGIYFTKYYIPFLLQPLSILQELNIAFHHNKKLNKISNKVLTSPQFNENCINTQLIPADILKKNKFRSDWPFGKKGHRKRRRINDFQSDDSNRSDSSSDGFSSEDEEDDQLSNLSEEFEERMAEIERMEEESYLSMSNNDSNQSHLQN